MQTQFDWTRINNDVNGNPRYVVHFLQCEPQAWKYQGSPSERYARVCKLMNRIGGRKFSNKQYGGGIVFQSHSLPETEAAIRRLLDEDLMIGM